MRPNLMYRHPDRRGVIARAAVVPVIAALAVGGCGSTGSSKPSYCTARSNLEQSVKALPSTDVLKNGTKALQANIEKVVTNAKALVSAAKSDFPNETTAINSSVNALSATLHEIEAKGPTTSDIAVLPGQISAVASSVTSFTKATASKCS